MFKRRRDEPGAGGDANPPQQSMAPPPGTPLFPAATPEAAPADTGVGVPPFRPAPSKEAPAMARPPFNTAPPPNAPLANAPPPGQGGGMARPGAGPGAAPGAPQGAPPAPQQATPPSPPPQQAPHPQTPGLSPGGPGQRSQTQERRTLVVGRGISLQGVIQDAERLVVEGTVEAQLLNASELAVAAGGIFKGEVEVEDSEIAGTMDGAVTARGSLIVRSTGKIVGTARCRRLQVEDGGQISGRIEMITEPAAPARAAE